MFDSKQFREHILKPALSMIKHYSDEAEELLMFTCAVESNGGKYVKQVKGPACGVFQMEPLTHDDIWRNYIARKPALTYPLGYNLGINQVPLPDRMIYDLDYAAAMARIHYLRVKEALPAKDDVDAIWAYYKKYYNTPLGKATKAKSIEKYYKFVGNPKDPIVELKTVK